MSTRHWHPRGVVLFVYGTLRAGAGGEMHRRLSAAALDVAPAECAGCLYDIGAYPAAVPSSDARDRIRGDVYLLPERKAAGLLADLDRYEGVTEEPAFSLFRRERTNVALEDGREVDAWIYRYARSTEGLSRIEEQEGAAEWRSPLAERDS